MPHLILGTAGHIDHGKSSLVKRLTGTDPDRLPEEKARGVTIELGFAHLTMLDDSTQYDIGIIDVPGHADFVNNMVAGVGALDVAIFIIAADDGWMPQSEEHLHILTYLGIKNIIIAMTKADLCEDVPFAVELLKDELQETAIADAPIIPVSSITGEGIDELKATLLKTLKTCPAHPDAGKPRLAIDRLFSPKGAGTVVTGTLTGGKLALGETLTLQPLGIPAKVRFIQNHSQALDTALPGMRTALNLPDLPIDAPGKAGAQRGHSLTTYHDGQASDTLDIALTRMDRAIPGIKPRPLRHMETVIIHHGSARCKARVILHDLTHLHAGESCIAQLRLETPIFILTGDRLVLRDGSQQSTVAGGVVLDTLPKRQGFRSEKRIQFLQPRAEKPHDPLVALQTLLTRDHFLDSSKLLPNNPFSQETIDTSVQNMLGQGSITQKGNLLIHTKWWKSQRAEADKTIKSYHRRHPDLPTMPLEELAKTLPDLSAQLFPLLTTEFSENGYSIQEKGIAHPSHSLTLPEELENDAKLILATLERTGLQPPNKFDIATTAKLEQAMKFLIRSAQVIELEPKIVISANTRALAIDSITSHLSQHGKATASELKDHLNTSRKIAMPLLEHLDTLGITIRTDNHRSLAS
ncbi:MAG: selenocysteine-specific translation elongation factor [Akkermansiaceae bacterium]